MTRLMVMVVALATAFGLASPAAAGSGVPVNWVQATCSVDAGEMSQSGGAIHGRGEVHHDVVWMNPSGEYINVGTNLITMDYDVSLRTGNGRAGGTFLAELFGGTATFSGHFNGGIKAGMLTAHAVGDGGGDFAGAKMTATIAQFQPTEGEREWLCDGEEVTKAVRVSAVIRP